MVPPCWAVWRYQKQRIQVENRKAAGPLATLSLEDSAGQLELATLVEDGF